MIIGDRSKMEVFSGKAIPMHINIRLDEDNFVILTEECAISLARMILSVIEHVKYDGGNE